MVGGLCVWLRGFVVCGLFAGVLVGLVCWFYFSLGLFFCRGVGILFWVCLLALLLSWVWWAGYFD